MKVRFQDDVIMGETAEISVEGKLLQGEVLQISPDFKNPGCGIAEMQVFEDLTGARIGDAVEFKGTPLSVLVGPGLLTSIWDGLQNPANKSSPLWDGLLNTGQSSVRFRNVLSCAGEGS